MSKFIWEITAQDLLEHAIWQFPHWKDETVDETVISPASESDALDPNSDLLVKAKFTDAKGNKFFGYIKIASTGIENTQPCMFFNGEAIGFWFSISKPNSCDLPKLHFPIEAVSESIHGLPSQVETIRGYGYLGTNSIVYC